MSDVSIAIIGASCRFPGAPGLEPYWELLTSGTDAITEVDERRWSTRFYYHPSRAEPGKSYTWSAGLIGDVDLFEPAFFGISPREAAQMDPQQRILLELVWHAAEDAGIPSAKLAGTATGVYIGAASSDYRDLRLGDPASGDSYFMTGGTLSILANRISHVFDLRGPSLTVDTACSSSLVALHHACEAIRDGRIGSAIVGGINLLLSPYPFLGFCRASMLARRGRRRRHPEAARCRARRRRPHPRRDPRHRRQLGRPHDRPVTAERGGADRADPQRVRARRGERGRSGIFRNARHRHTGRRPDRGGSGRAGARPRAPRAAADR